MKKKKEVIVIGSGVGGLTSAIALAKSGHNVKVLEHHSVPGGYIQSFKHKKWKFNVGTHYVSNMDMSDDLNNRLLKSITGNRLTFTPMNPVFEKIFFQDGSSFDYLESKEQYIQSLKDLFPDEAAGINSFFADIEKVTDNTKLIVAPRLFTGLLNTLLRKIGAVKLAELRFKTLKDLLDKHITDNRLRNILSLHCGKILSTPDELSFLTYSIVKNSYFHGGSYPKGSGDAIIDAMHEELKKYGGSLTCRQDVQKINLKNGAVKGVTLKDNTFLTADCVISNIGILETYEQLIDSYKESKRYAEVSKNLVPSRSYITLYIGLEGDISSFNITNTNFRILSDSPFRFDVDPTTEEYHPDYLTIVFPSLRDSAHTDTEHHTAEIFIPTSYQFFAQWDESCLGKRGDEYKTLKKQLETKILDVFEKHFPGIGKHVAYTNLSTPLTKKSYIRRKNGAVCGLSSTPDKMTSNLLHPVSDYKGLYFTGADVFVHGIIGSCLSGIIAASSVEKKNLLNSFS